MPYEICLVSSDNFDEFKKLKRFFHGEKFSPNRKCSVEYVIQCVDLVNEEFSYKHRYKLPNNPKIFIEDHVAEVSNMKDSVFENILNTIHLKDELPSHVRWFGHGSAGKLCGRPTSDNKRYRPVSYRDIARIIAITRTCLFSVYCCNSGNTTDARKAIPGYVANDLPIAIFNALKKINTLSPFGDLIINSNVTSNMWEESTAFEDFPCERHTHFCNDIPKELSFWETRHLKFKSKKPFLDSDDEKRNLSGAKLWHSPPLGIRPSVVSRAVASLSSDPLPVPDIWTVGAMLLDTMTPPTLDALTIPYSLLPIATTARQPTLTGQVGIEPEREHTSHSSTDPIAGQVQLPVSVSSNLSTTSSTVPQSVPPSSSISRRRLTNALSATSTTTVSSPATRTPWR